MSDSLFGSNLESKITLERESAPLPEDQPFRILVMGDWSGSSSFAKKDISERRPLEIDRDEFDTVMRKISPELELKFQGDGNNSLKIKFENLDDFHPDNIFQQLPLFADLRDIRQRLKKADTYDEAAREVRSWYSDSSQKSDNEQRSPEPDLIVSNPQTEESLLDQILGGRSEAASIKKAAPKSDLSEFIGNIVAPHIVKTDLEEQSKLLMIVDEVISDLMRKILHHKDFQNLEAAWRGLYFLVRRVETDNSLKIYIVQVTKGELLDNLSNVNSLEDSDFYRWVVDEGLSSGERKPWAVICGNYSFQSTVEDTAALIRIGKVAKEGNSPFISHTKLDFLQGSSAQKVSEESAEYKLWATLRSVAESAYLGLANSRFMGRLPYGETTDPTENFSFEEFRETPVHHNYLWLNPCFAYAYALAQEYKIDIWHINLDKSFDLENIPLHIYQFEGETVTKNCAENEMTETMYNLVRQEGLMSLVAFRNTDRIRLSALRSISGSSPSLSGKWSD